MARRLGDPMLIATALWARYWAGLSPVFLAEREADAAEWVRYAEMRNDPLMIAWAYISRMITEIERGTISAANASIAVIRDYNERAHITYVAIRTAAYQAQLDLACGRYAEAEYNIRRADELWQSATPSQYQCQAFLLYRDTGRLDRFPVDIQLPNHLHLWRVTAQAHRMALALERGQIDQARADYEALFAIEIMNSPFDNEWCATVARLVEASVRFGDRDRAALMSEWLAPYADRIMSASGTAMTHGPTTLYLGQLAFVLEQWEQADRHLHHALETSERVGFVPFAARALVGLAQVAIGRDAPGDREAGRQYAERAVSVAESIGMNGLLPLATQLRDSLSAQSNSAVSQAGVTARELDVLRLVSQGLSDAEVAERLYVSRRTVQSHLHSLYSKLGVSSRTAAARWAIEHGID
jgi:ATP/maltotriose-dependent transcriptional regulator MalT